MLDALIYVVATIVFIAAAVFVFQLWVNGAINRDEARETLAEDVTVVKGFWKRFVEWVKSLRKKT